MKKQKTECEIEIECERPKDYGGDEKARICKKNAITFLSIVVRVIGDLRVRSEEG